VNAGGRSADFPLFLSSTTEQVLATGVRAGFGFEDDAGLVRVYLPKEPDLVLKQAPCVTATSEDESKLKLVTTAMAAVHLVSAMEAMSLGATVGLDTKQLFEICVGAAGTSWMFKDRIPQLLSGKWASTKTIDETITELVSWLLRCGENLLMRNRLHLLRRQIG
jgi:3-hydroxyisobutyrate dehydrogenase